MNIIVLAAGQGTRLRPLTEEQPKCMVSINGTSIIERQIETMSSCGVQETDITIVSGYRSDVLQELLKDRGVNFIYNKDYETTNMVCSLLCAREQLENSQDVIVTYGDIIYTAEIFKRILESQEEISVVVDDGWHDYWKQRCENPLDDAETLMYDKNNYLTEIGQKTEDIKKIQSQYIGLMRYQRDGIKKVLKLCDEARNRSRNGIALWKTERSYQKMYMTDMLQGLIETGEKIKAIHILRGWYEIDCAKDLWVAEREV